MNIALLSTAPLALAVSTPQAVWLTHDGAESADSGGVRFLLWAALLLVLSVSVGGLISWWAWRDERRYAPAERGGRAVARALGLGKPAMTALTRLASAAGIPLAALVLSEAAFDAAAARATSASVPEPIVNDLRRRIFSVP